MWVACHAYEDLVGESVSSPGAACLRSALRERAGDAGDAP